MLSSADAEISIENFTITNLSERQADESEDEISVS